MSNEINKQNRIVDSNNDYTAPEHDKTAFHCPHCGVYAKQNWHNVCRYNYNDIIQDINRRLHIHGVNNIEQFLCKIYNHSLIENNEVSFCDCCAKYSIWVDQKMVYPHLSTAPWPVAEMPETVKELYNEARIISNQSPRGACALLRLAVQNLVKKLGENESNLNMAIGNLVKRGLSKKIQQALDTVRVIGNDAVHPGEINVKDNPKIAGSLFMLVNFISEKMITEDKKVDAIYSSLPKGKIEAINERDKK